MDTPGRRRRSVLRSSLLGSPTFPADSAWLKMSVRPPPSKPQAGESLELDVGDVDGVIIATMDDMHVEPTPRFAHLAVPMLLEKPIGRTWADCCRLRDELPGDAPPILVAHVLRYAGYTQLLRSMIDDGALGEVVNVHLLEPVGFWHFAHSFVRGNWHSSATSAGVRGGQGVPRCRLDHASHRV